MLRRTTAIAVALAIALLGACGSDDGGSASTTSTAAGKTTTTAPSPLVIVVTDDDGIGAPGIDALATAVQAIDGVEVHVVAPATDKTGTSDTTTSGGATYAAGKTVSGIEGTAVAGYPADSVNVAIDDLGLKPDLVVSGVNPGQNVGTLASLSGTVGAARTAVRRGVPAVASSAGLGELADFELGARLVVDWITEHRAELANGTAQTDTVTSFNVPGCKAGEPKALVEVQLATALPKDVNFFETADCAADVASEPTTDVDAMIGGYLAVTQVPPDL